MFGNDWDDILQDEMKEPYFQDLQETIKKEYKEHTVYPPLDHLYEALRLTPYQETKALILGQDPYHGAGQAHGLSFSVLPGVRIPPSLRNMYKELHDDLGTEIPNHGCLTHWGQEGVLLLNTVLTVREGQPTSHQGLGWELFTDAIIKKLNEREESLVFILWGSHAIRKAQLINSNIHKIVQSTHPSPLAAYRGFLGSRPFSQCNEFLQSIDKAPIDWAIPNL
ncbi:uracil-DNA glycosylase [Paenibacillus sp. DS2015]|uniref:uracil-DNA glycosylase n=1 Tax=Paenibacillus sp. DS2015 TaxID=3373917 RepID=UPI003D1B33D1